MATTYSGNKQVLKLNFIYFRFGNNYIFIYLFLWEKIKYKKKKKIVTPMTCDTISTYYNIGYFLNNPCSLYKDYNLNIILSRLLVCHSMIACSVLPLVCAATSGNFRLFSA